LHAVKAELSSLSVFLFEGDAAGLSVAIRYGDSKGYAPTHNLTTYHRVVFAMVFCYDYDSEQNFEPSCPYSRNSSSFDC
jgi:hypothetical protein